ncbi:MAG TPA: hypothetical protein VGB98_24730, partial [Pyrinomonadaceae bacterium]
AELEAAYTEAASLERGLLRMLFGAERASVYRLLERKSESLYDHEGADEAYRALERMQGELSERDRNRLFGIGEPFEPEPGEINEYIRALSALDYDTPAALGDSLKYAFIKVGDETRPDAMRGPQQRGYAQIRAAALHAEAQGWDARTVLYAAAGGIFALYDDRADAELVSRRALRIAEEVEQGASWFYVWTRESGECSLAP